MKSPSLRGLNTARRQLQSQLENVRNPATVVEVHRVSALGATESARLGAVGRRAASPDLQSADADAPAVASAGAALVLSEPQVDAAEAAPSRVPSGRLWEEAPVEVKRKLPRKALLAAGAFTVLLIFVSMLGHSSTDTHARVAPVADHLPSDELAVSEQDLKNRREVSPSDFTSSSVSRPEMAPRELEPPPLETGGPADTDLAARRAARNNDPEDLITHRGRPAADSAPAAPTPSYSSASQSPATTTEEQPAAAPPAGGFRRPFVFFPAAAASAAKPASPSGTVGVEESILAPAGASIPVVLTTPLTVSSGGITVIARTASDGALPKGTRFVGTADLLPDNRLGLHFSKAILPDGRLARANAEAQDTDGAFGVAGQLVGPDPNSTGRVAGDVTAEIAGDVASDTLGMMTGGLAGQALSDAVNRATSRRASFGRVDSRRLTLAGGARFALFLHDPVVLTN